MNDFLDKVEPGNGILLTNKKKPESKAPDLRGVYVFDKDVTFRAGDKMKLSAWVYQKTAGMLIRIREDTWQPDPDKKYKPPYQAKKPYEVQDEDDSIPF